MSTERSRLCGPVVLQTSATLIYLCPQLAKTSILRIEVSNPTANAQTFTLSIGSDVAADRIYTMEIVGAGQRYAKNCDFVLFPGEYILASGSSSLVIVLSGIIVRVGRALLEVSHNGRYLVNGTGAPWRLHGYVAWSGIVCLNQTDAITVLDDLHSKGFNALILNLIEYLFTADPPKNAFGDPPFDSTVTGSHLDFTDPNDAYWAHVDWFLARMREREMVAWAFPAYYGFIGAIPYEGWGASGTLAANGTTRLNTYGAWLATRYVNVPGIVWGNFGDGLPSDKQYVKAIYDGIRSVDTVHLHTSHYARPSLSTDDGTIPCDLNLAYSKGATAGTPFPHEKILDGYAVSPIVRPVFLGEDYYEAREPTSNPPTLTLKELRANGWGPVCSGACGAFYGNNKTWSFGVVTPNNPSPDWPAHMNDPGCLQRAHVRSFFDAREWWKLVPSTGTGLVTSGGGSLSTQAYKPRAIAANGSWGVVYIYDGSTVTIDLSLFSGTVTARWYDPTNGTFSAVTGGPTFSNSGTHAFVASSEVGNNAAGDSDWVLALEVLS